MATRTILIVDDDPQIRRVLRTMLIAQEYEVADARDGQEALEKVARGRFDLVILDMNMPVLDGLETCRTIRATSDTAIIMLTVRNTESDKFEALDAGADDYIAKPFSAPELLARIRVALRRTTAENSVETGVLEAGALTIDYDRRRVVRDDTEIRLTPKEFDLLSLLARNHDRVLTHRAILKAVWGANAVEQPEHLWTLVAQLRKKIEPDPSQPKYLVSEPWVGYRFVTDAK